MRGLILADERISDSSSGMEAVGTRIDFVVRTLQIPDESHPSYNDRMMTIVRPTQASQERPAESASLLAHTSEPFQSTNTVTTLGRYTQQTMKTEEGIPLLRIPRAF